MSTFQVNLSATPATVVQGDTFVLAWSIEGGSLPLTASIDQGIGAVATPTGSLPIVATDATNYTITVTDRIGDIVTSTISVAISITPVPFSGTITVDATMINPPPDEFTGVVAWNSGLNLRAGDYLITYQTGAWSFKVGDPLQWRVGVLVITDGDGNVVPWNLPSTAPFTFSTQGAAIAAVAPPKSMTYHHVGGKPIGAYAEDALSGDNANGTPSPTLLMNEQTFTTIYYPLFGTLSADDLTITAGNSTTLRWTSENATAASLDNGIGAVSLDGSQSISPTVTTTYILTLTAPNATTVTIPVTVTVLPLLAPVSLGAVSGCGTVDLAWSTSQDFTLFNILRNGVQIGTSSGTTYTDAPPLPWTNYSYTVQAVNGAVTGAQSIPVVGQSSAPLPVPTGLVATAYPNFVGLRWNAVPHATSYIVYRSTVSGEEVAIASGFISTSYNDYVNGGTFFYTVAAVGACGVSAASEEITAMAQTVTACSPIEIMESPNCTSSDMPGLPNLWS